MCWAFIYEQFKLYLISLNVYNNLVFIISLHYRYKIFSILFSIVFFPFFFLMLISWLNLYWSTFTIIILLKKSFLCFSLWNVCNSCESKPTSRFQNCTYLKKKIHSSCQPSNFIFQMMSILHLWNLTWVYFPFLSPYFPGCVIKVTTSYFLSL